MFENMFFDFLLFPFLPVPSSESSGGFTNPPSTDSGGGIFFDFPNPIVVIITDDKMIKNMICGYMLLHLVNPW